MNIPEEIRKMQEYSQITCSAAPDEIINRISDSMVYLARTNEMLANAKKALRDKKASEIGETIIKIAKQNFLSAKAQNALVDSICSEENYLVDTLDRLSATFTHQLDALRSMLSYERENMRLTKTGY
jgi:hypothetical protein